MPATRVSYRWALGWVLFYGGLLPYALPRCLDWMSRPSNWWLGCGAAGTVVLGAGIVLSLYQAGRRLARWF
ncbi:hypothetical protein [Hymenobacter guriensis]|uniref:Uncharacterized protein n=1 Tax=Hymenobacter guriensis TaxID=2793065 RepID=A0ABS0L8A4_9BACT|nr:hypothetical protein [Hymenobacter guriensis]MBG8556381.1 hypothetical protein [Hymenobacter guriensis]